MESCDRRRRGLVVMSVDFYHDLRLVEVLKSLPFDSSTNDSRAFS
jgi:hypothetical protein